MDQIRFLSAKQTSKCLQIPLRTIQHLSKEGKIRAIKIGKKWKYRKEDIENYLHHGTDFSIEPVRKQNYFIERRNFTRINTDFDCQYSINLPRFKVINNKGIIKNLSASGVLVICQDDGIEIEDPINLNFMDIKAEGRVVRKDRDGFGIKFRNINEEDKVKIIKYIG